MSAKTAETRRIRRSLFHTTCDREFYGAQKRTRTSTTLRSLAPEASASTNSAIWAQMVAGFYEWRVALSMLFHEENAKPRLRLVCQGPEG